MARLASGESRFYPLSERERNILRLVVQRFVDTADPVGSRFLSTHYPLGLSPATIRNTLNDLETRGFLDHPYTSAGRVPTERGYRAYVDALMAETKLSPGETARLESHLRDAADQTDVLVRESSRLLGQLANLLGVAISPRIATGRLERLEVVPLSSTRVMFVVSVRGGLIRTIIMHADTELSRTALERIVTLLNERLGGLTLEEIRKTCRPRVQDLDGEQSGIVRLLMDASPVLFSEPPENRKVELAGTPNILAQPEFREADDVRDLIALLDDEAAVVRLLEGADPEGEVAKATVKIGTENSGNAERVKRYSVVTAPYHRATMRGTIGIIGPMRMDYARVVALVEGMAAMLSWSPDDEDSNG